MNLGIVTGQASGIAVVDIDGEQGRATLDRLAVELGPLPATAAVASGRVGGGLHLYYRISGPAPENDGDGLDIRGDGGLVVAPPSHHASGNVYHWVEPQLPLIDLPGAWLEYFANRGSKRAPRAESNANAVGMPAWLVGRSRQRLADRAVLREPVPIEDIIAVLAAIPNPDLPWNEWNKLAMAVWDAGGGSEDSRVVFEAFSAKSKKHIADTSRERWEFYFRSPPTEIGFGSLVHLAREAVPGFVLPSQQPKPGVS